MADAAGGEHPGRTGGTLRVIAAASALGTLGPVATLGYQAGLTPAVFSALRAGIGAGVLGVLLVTGRQPSVRLAGLTRREKTLLTVAVVVNGLMNLALFFAFGAMTVALVMVIFYTYPVLTAVGSVALGRERMTRARVAALACSALGLALVLGGQVGPDAHATLAGVLLAALAASGHAIYLIVIRGGFDRVPAAQATSLVLAGGFAISGTAALIATGTGIAGDWALAPGAWAAVLFAGTFGAAFPKVWVLGGVRLIGSTRAAVVMLMEPVVAVVAAAVLLGQAVSPPELLGGIAILAAVVIVQRPDPAARAERQVLVEALE